MSSLAQHADPFSGGGSPPADRPALRLVKPPPHNLPLDLTRFIGRERERAELADLLTPPAHHPAGTDSLPARLVTLTGPGGSGKTRLALQAGADALPDYPDGVWLIELAPLADASLVPQAVASVVGVREQPGRPLTEVLAEYLGSKDVLLLLDNCEHLLASCAHLAHHLLRACPTLRLLATSQAPLGLPGETVYPVPPLAIPPSDESVGSVEDSRQSSVVRRQLADYASVQLFVERARAVQRDFALTGQNEAAVAQVCRRLDGIPLAIELAAARVRVMTPQQIAARLDDRFRLLTGGSKVAPARQQTLRAAVEWSYGLLSPQEQTVLRRLSVFAGSFSIEAVEAVCGDEQGQIDAYEVFDHLARLVDRSLVETVRGEGETRYRLLETIRQYAHERLVAAGEADVVRRRHAAFYLALAEAGEVGLSQAEGADWLDQLETEHDNLRAALGWCSEAGELGWGLGLAAALHLFWYVRGYLTEWRAWLENLLTRVEGQGLLRERLRGHHALGWLALYQTDLSTAHAHATRSLTLAEEIGDLPGQADARNLMGETARLQGDAETARRRLREAIALFRRVDNLFGLLRALVGLANVHFSLGDQAQARVVLDECRGLRIERFPIPHVAALAVLGEICRLEGETAQAIAYIEQALQSTRRIRYAEAEAILLANLGYLVLNERDTARAQGLFQEALRGAVAVGKRDGTAWCLAGLAGVAVRSGQPTVAARLLAASEAILTTFGRQLEPTDQADFDRIKAETHAALIAPDFITAWAEGQALTIDQAVALALTVAVPPAPSDVSSPLPLADTGPGAAPPSAVREDQAEGLLPPLPVGASPLRLGEGRGEGPSPAAPLPLPSAPSVRLYALGPARVTRDERPLTPSDWTYAKARELLFFLLDHPSATREQIGLALWPDASPAQLRQSFHPTLYHLRKALGQREWVLVEEESYRFNRGMAYWYDVAVFEAAVHQARVLRQQLDTASQSPIPNLQSLSSNLQSVEEGLALYQGDYLTDFTSGEWYLERREALGVALIAGLLDLGAVYLGLGRHAEAARVYGRVIGRDNLQEEAHRELMRALARGGERGQALRVYGRLVERLKEELGVEPDRETRAVAERIKRGEEV